MSTGEAQHEKCNPVPQRKGFRARSFLIVLLLYEHTLLSFLYIDYRIYLARRRAEGGGGGSAGRANKLMRAPDVLRVTVRDGKG